MKNAADRPDKSLRKILPGLAAAASLGLLGCAPSSEEPDFAMSVEQHLGFATVSWQAVDGAERYLIERYTGEDGDSLDDEPLLVGVWLPDRYSPQLREGGELTFADAGFALGGRYGWRVRAVLSDTAEQLSAIVAAETLAPSVPDTQLTAFERSQGAQWTPHEAEVTWLRQLGDTSGRLDLQQLGETLEGRPINLVVIPSTGNTVGGPPPATVLINCTVHGGERAPREACLLLIRALTTAREPWVADVLENTTVLINPTVNPDGQVTATRTNTTGQDLNRDHILLRHPESLALAKVIRDHRPQMIIDGHELGRGDDLHWLWPRSLTVGESLWQLSQETLTRDYAFSAAAEAGWAPTIWGTHRMDGWETLMQNTAGLKNAIGQLQESPRVPNEIRPAEVESGSAANQLRRVYSHLWGFKTHLIFTAATLITLLR